jgi:hypothetical protein
VDRRLLLAAVSSVLSIWIGVVICVVCGTELPLPLIVTLAAAICAHAAVIEYQNLKLNAAIEGRHSHVSVAAQLPPVQIVASGVQFETASSPAA